MIRLEDLGIDRHESITSLANVNPIFSLESESLSDVVKKFILTGHRKAPIVNKNMELVGILAYTDVLDALLKGLSRNTSVATVMTRKVISSEVKDSISDILQKMKILKKGGLPLIKNSKLVGTISERDFIKNLSKKYTGISVSDIMTHKPFYISTKSTILHCIKAMTNARYRRLPVLDGKEIVGVVTAVDVLKYLNQTNFNHIYLNESIEEIFTTPVYHVFEHDDISDVIKIILENNIGGIIVTNENNFLRGIVTERDIIEIIK